MKKICVCLVLIFALSSLTYSQSASEIIHQFSKSKDVQRIHIGRVGMFFVKILSSNEAELHSLAKGIKSLEVLALNDDCKNEKKNEHQNNLKTLQDDEHYATLLTVKDDDDNVRIMLRREKDVIRELILIVCDTDDIAVVKLKGKIKETDLKNTIAQYNKKR